MKSYFDHDRRVFFGLLFLALAAGVTGRFFETEHFTFPGANNLNQAAALLATQDNIVGTPDTMTAPTLTLAVAETAKKLAGISPVPDVSFSREADCAQSGAESDMTIKTAHGRTVGFLCLDAKDPNFDAAIRADAPKVNALVVSPNFGEKTTQLQMTAVSRGALADGAALVVGIGPTASSDVETYNGSPIVYSLGEIKTKDKDSLSTANVTGEKVTNVVISAK